MADAIKIEPVVLKQIEALNDYIALWIRPPVIEGLELTEEMKAKYQNEGVVIGLGPDVNRGQWHNYTGTQYELNLGDQIVVRGNKYQMVQPKNGVYAGQTIAMVHKPDLVYRHSKADPTKYVFGEIWNKSDTDEARTANS